MHKKNILAQDHRAKKNSCTYSELEKNSGKMFPELTHWTLSISRLLNDFSIWTWVLIKEGFVVQYCVLLGCFYLYINSTCGFQYSYIFLLNSDHGWCWDLKRNVLSALLIEDARIAKKSKINYINNYLKQICNDKVFYSTDKKYFSYRQLVILQKLVKQLSVYNGQIDTKEHIHLSNQNS